MAATMTTVDRKALAEAVALAMGCTGRTVPATECVLLRWQGGSTLVVEATDLSAWMVLGLAADAWPGEDGKAEWAALVSPRALIAALRLPGAAVRVSLGFASGDDARWLEIGLGDGALARLPSLPVEVWPVLVREPDGAGWKVPAGALAAAWQAVVCAASEAEDRATLAAVHLRLTALDGALTLTLTATDGRRMHQAWITTAANTADATEAGEALLRSDDAGRLAQFLAASAGSNGEVLLRICDGTVVLDAVANGLTQRLALKQQAAEKSYPDVRQVVPDAAFPTVRVEVDGAMAAALATGLRRLEATDGRTPGMARLRVDVEGALLRMDSATTAADLVQAESAVPAEISLPEAMTAALAEATLDIRFLCEALAGAAAAGVPAVIGLRGPGRPATVERPGALCVVMPMSV